MQGRMLDILFPFQSRFCSDQVDEDEALVFDASLVTFSQSKAQMLISQPCVHNWEGRNTREWRCHQQQSGEDVWEERRDVIEERRCVIEERRGDEMRGEEKRVESSRGEERRIDRANGNTQFMTMANSFSHTSSTLSQARKAFPLPLSTDFLPLSFLSPTLIFIFLAFPQA